MLESELVLRLTPTNPVQGEFVRAASPHGDGGGTPPSQYLGGLGGGSAIAHQPQPPDLGSHEAIDPKFKIAVNRPVREFSRSSVRFDFGLFVDDRFLGHDGSPRAPELYGPTPSAHRHAGNSRLDWLDTMPKCQ
jgi:hypothetical protein